MASTTFFPNFFGTQHTITGTIEIKDGEFSVGDTLRLVDCMGERIGSGKIIGMNRGLEKENGKHKYLIRIESADLIKGTNSVTIHN